MLWILIISCAVGVRCGLVEPYTHNKPFSSEDECRMVFDWGMDLGGTKGMFRAECRKVDKFP